MGLMPIHIEMPDAIDFEGAIAFTEDLLPIMEAGQVPGGGDGIGDRRLRAATRVVPRLLMQKQDGLTRFSIE